MRAGVELGLGVFANDVGAKFDRLSRRKMALRDDGPFVGSKPDKPRFWKGRGKGRGDKVMLLHRLGWNLSICPETYARNVRSISCAGLGHSEACPFQIYSGL